MPLQRVEHLVKGCGFGGLIGGMEHSQQSIPPSDCSAGGIDAVIPVVVGVAVTLPQTLWRRVSDELPQNARQSPGCAEVSLVASSVIPPGPRSFKDADLRKRIHSGCRVFRF